MFIKPKQCQSKGYTIWEIPPPKSDELPPAKRKRE